jgi:hypothetical protein
MSSIIERIRKLRALGSSSNSHEATAAVQLAQRLMDEHKLVESDLGSDATFDERPAKGDFSSAWRWSLLSAAARLHLCEVVGSQMGDTKAARIVGEPQRAREAQDHYERLAAWVIGLSRRERDDPPNEIVDALLAREITSRDYLEAFRLGVAKRIVDGLRSQVIVSESTELVLRPGNTVRDYVSEHYPKTEVSATTVKGGCVKPPENDFERLGRWRGYQAGQQVSLV